MPDREKVIKGLENCTDIYRECSDGCPYFHKIELPDCMQLRKDALALLKEQQEKIDRLFEESASNAEIADGLKELLKEQEAVEPKAIRMNAFGHPVYACGKCGLLITESMNYCHECGKPILWKGR